MLVVYLVFGLLFVYRNQGESHLLRWTVTERVRQSSLILPDDLTVSNLGAAAAL